MTKIRMLQQMSGYRNGAPWPGVGETMDVDPEEAATLVLGQTPIAEIAEDTHMPPPEERAVVPEPEVPVETATATRPGTATRSRSTAPKK